MEGDGGEGDDLTPFWLQSNADLRRGDRLRRGVSSFFLNSGLVVFLLLVTAVVFLAFVLPSTLSFSAQMLRPNSVKRSWDSLNVVLVLVAVVFGFLSRNKNEDRYGYVDEFSKESELRNGGDVYRTDGGRKLDLSNSREWYGDSEIRDGFDQRTSFLRRNSSSYPELREFSNANWDFGGYQRRFFDDFHVDPGRISDPDPGRIHRRHRSLEAVDKSFGRPPSQNKTVIVDTLVTKSPPLPPLAIPEMTPETMVEPEPEPKAEPTPAPDVEEKNPRGKTRKERSKRKPRKDLERMNPIIAPVPPPPPPPPAADPSQEKSSKSDRKRGGATGSATKDFLNSLYHKKKKKQRQKSVDNLDSLVNESQPPLSFHLPPPQPQSPPPPPPPLPPSPPPPSVLQNLFSLKKQKRKRTIKVTLAPHPNSDSQNAPSTSHNPPKPIKLHTFEKLEETSNSGGESPLNRIPPPPPPPPPAFYKTPAWKFVIQGDYVRVNSTTSSRSGSPDPDELDSDVTPSTADGGTITPFHPSPLFCPSPDVNTKAESFITNFREKLKLEKIHSMKKGERGPSSLGPKQIN